MTIMPTMPCADLAIDLSNVEKTYRGKVRALRGVSMRVNRGEVFGLLGPNGAGKSTLVKILMTIVRPTKCQGRLLGDPIGRKETLARVGYLPEHMRFPEYLTGAQTLDYMGALAKVPRTLRKSRTGELLELVGMSDWKSKKIGSYSKGMKQRMGVAQALMNDPDIVLLDEPTDGVDPVGRRDIRVVMQEMKNRGKTIFINSHLLGEVEMVCDRVAILVQGQVEREGTIDELTEGGRRYEIDIALDSAASHRPDALTPQTLLEGVATLTPTPCDSQSSASPTAKKSGSKAAPKVVYKGQLSTGESIELVGRTLRLNTVDAQPAQPVIDALRSHGVVITGVRLVRPSLEDLFIQAVMDPQTGKAKKVGAEKNKTNGSAGA